MSAKRSTVLRGVSGNRLGLLSPARVDPDTGYRYYSIRQLPRLNRVLALKELGLTLEQIAPLLENELSQAELRGMLTMKRAQIEQSLRTEMARLRHIESRIEQIDQQGRIEDYEIVVKAVPAAPYLSMRTLCEGMDQAVATVSAVAESAVRHIRPALREKLIVVLRNDSAEEQLDLEVGFSLLRPSGSSFRIDGDRLLQANDLLAVVTTATLVRSGPTRAIGRSARSAAGSRPTGT